MREVLRRGYAAIKKLPIALDHLYTWHRREWWRNRAKGMISGELTDSEKKAVSDYYRQFGFKVYPEYPEFYKEKLGKIDERFIPDDFHYCVIDPYFNDWKLADAIDNKCYYDLYFSGVKQPESLGYRINGLWYTGNKVLTSIDSIKLSLVSVDCAFVKAATDSFGGHGVFYIGGPNIQAQFENAIRQVPADIVIQKAIIQHDTMKRLNETSVNSVRLISLLSENGVKIYSAVVRMGINGARVDNASSGGITCGIYPDGRLKSVAYSADGKRYDKHPSSGVCFSDFMIPNYRALHELVKKLHPLMPHFRLISWDVAIDQNENPVLIEANLKSGEIDFHQLNNGPLFGEDTESILREIQMNRKK